MRLSKARLSFIKRKESQTPDRGKDGAPAFERGEQINLLPRQGEVLVVNSSTRMAQEITSELRKVLPGYDILFSPSLELARWLLTQKRISLVVSSSILADGGVVKLKPTLESLSPPPPLVILGDLPMEHAEELGNSLYCFSSLRFIQRAQQHGPQLTVRSGSAPIGTKISSLGATLRDKLNNPLQEIVAMTFVAQHGAQQTEVVDSALQAISSAARRMASMVNKLEEDIKGAMLPPK